MSRCCPAAWKRDGACFAASSTSPPMTAASGVSARWSPRWRSTGWPSRDVRGLETAIVRALWRATRLSRAKEVIFTVLSKGHRIYPVMHTRYERLLCLARVAWRPAVTQVFTQAIWQSGGPPPGTVGRALRTAATLG